MKLKMTNLFFSCALLASCNSHKSNIPFSGPFVSPVKEEVGKVTPPHSENDFTGDIKKTQPLIIKKRAVEFNSNFTNIDEFKKNLNQYFIHGEVSEIDSDSSLICETLNPTSEKRIFRKDFSKDEREVNIFIDFSERNEQVEKISCKIKNKEKIITESQFVIKKDLIIKGVKDYHQLKLISGKNELGALVFEDNSYLQTLGDHLNIVAEELIAQNALITSYVDNINNKAADNKNGRGGGVLNINANKAYGSLVITMRGQNGGDQKNIPARRADAPSADYLLDAVNVKKSPNQPPFCTPDALKGYKGYKGHKGLDGTSGGNSGVAMVNIDDGTDFKLEIILLPGAGGLGGAPGEGGAGSPGGRGNGQDSNIVCPGGFSHDGAQGDKGDWGDKGSVGQDGQRERGYYFDAKNNLRIEY